MSRSNSSTKIENFRQTVFCSSNPNKELNPAKHIKKRSIQSIISGQDTAGSSTAIITNNNLHSYSFYNKENTKTNNNLESSNLSFDKSQQETLNHKKPTGKKIFKDQPSSQQQLSGNTRGSKIVDQHGTPIVDQQILHSRKGSGQYNMVQRGQLQKTDTRNQATKKMFENHRTNKETITNELQTIHLNNQLTPGYLKQAFSQRKTIPQYTSIQYCLDMEKNDMLENNNNKSKQLSNGIEKDDCSRNIPKQQQQQPLLQNYQSQIKNCTPARNQLSSNQIKIPERRVQRSNTSSNMATTTAQDAFGLNYNKPPAFVYQEPIQRLGLEKKRQAAKNTRTHESFYM